MKTKESDNFRIQYQKHGASDVHIQIQYEPGRYGSLLVGDVKDLRELGALISEVRHDTARLRQANALKEVEPCA